MAQIDYSVLANPADVAKSYFSGLEQARSRKLSDLLAQRQEEEYAYTQSQRAQAAQQEQERRSFIQSIPGMMEPKVGTARLRVGQYDDMGEQVGTPEDLVLPAEQAYGRIGNAGPNERVGVVRAPEVTPGLSFNEVSQKMLGVPGMFSQGWSSQENFNALKEKSKEARLLKQTEIEARMVSAAESQRQRAADAENMIRLAASLRPEKDKTITPKEVQDPASPTGWSWVDLRSGQKTIGAPAPSVTGQLSPRDATKRKAKLADDYQTLTGLMTDTDSLKDNLSAVRTAPGLSGATGWNALLPSVPGGDSASAEVKIGALEGKVTKLGKAAAAASGASGPMAVQEWKIVRDMIANLDPKKGTKAYLDQLLDIEEVGNAAIARSSDAYFKEYADDLKEQPQFADPQSFWKKGGGTQAPKPSGQSGGSPTLNGSSVTLPNGTEKRFPNAAQAQGYYQSIGGR